MTEDSRLQYYSLVRDWRDLTFSHAPTDAGTCDVTQRVTAKGFSGLLQSELRCCCKVRTSSH